MTDVRFDSVPEGWKVVSEEVVSNAERVVRASLEDDSAVDDLVTYYGRDGNYAGATFVELGPTSPWDITAADLLALTLLSVQAPPTQSGSCLSPQQNGTVSCDFCPKSGCRWTRASPWRTTRPCWRWLSCTKS